ncbi:MAG: hypothetical protein U1F43_11880 [Myxococcota bacterium]
MWPCAATSRPLFACPYDGPTAPEQVLPVVLAPEMGACRGPLGDTIGVGTPGPRVAPPRRAASTSWPTVASCCTSTHDTWGHGCRRSWRARSTTSPPLRRQRGYLGGCPYAKTATGNIATEDLLYLLDQLGYASGVSLAGVIEASQLIAQHLDHAPPSRVLKRRRRLRGGHVRGRVAEDLDQWPAPSARLMGR